jgi:hypothetical protein
MGDRPLPALPEGLVALHYGKHVLRSDGVCALEAAAWAAGEPHSDHPTCVCWVLGAYVRRVNDTVGTRDRQRLLPYVPRLVGTAATEEVRERRAAVILQLALSRVGAPLCAALGCEEAAAALAAPGDVCDGSVAVALHRHVSGARDLLSQARTTSLGHLATDAHFFLGELGLGLYGFLHPYGRLCTQTASCAARVLLMESLGSVDLALEGLDAMLAVQSVP